MRSKISSILSILLAAFIWGYPAYSLAGPIQPGKVDVAHQGFADLVDKVKPAVVSVQVLSDKQEEYNDFFGLLDIPHFGDIPDENPLKQFFKDFDQSFNHMKKLRKKGREHLVAQGSGFFISKDGYVVTNNHVVSGGSKFMILRDNGEELQAKLIGKDSKTDIALLKVNSKDNNLPYVPFGDDSKVRVGDWVVAVGNPFGLGGTVTAGIVSARGRDIGANVYDDFLQIDAAVNRGNSGGPTFDIAGEVVGINTAIYSPSGGSVGIAFAIPASTAAKVVEQLKAKGHVDRGILNIVIQTLTKDMASAVGFSGQKGAIVVSVKPGTAGYKAGLRIGDIIYAVQGVAIKDSRDLAKTVASYPANQKIELSIWRDGQDKKLPVILDSAGNDSDEDKSEATNESVKSKKSNPVANFGFELEANKNGKGLLVVAIDEDSDAFEKGLRAGDVILRINSKNSDSIEQFLSLIEQARKANHESVLLQIMRDETTRFFALPIVVKK